MIGINITQYLEWGETLMFYHMGYVIFNDKSNYIVKDNKTYMTMIKKFIKINVALWQQMDLYNQLKPTIVPTNTVSRKYSFFEKKQFQILVKLSNIF